MRIDVISLFPEMFSALTELGVSGRALKRDIWSLHTCNPRQFTDDVHHTVDDRPYGGGPGMVMLAEPLEQSLTYIRQQQTQAGLAHTPLILLSPTGQPFTQKLARQFSQSPGFTLLCGRYEGIDQRFIDRYVEQEISLGDFVLSGGEIAALAVIDAVVRLLPGVLNDSQSAVQDSFAESLSGLLDCPHYTRPEYYQGQSVPEVLLSGHHQKIALWRRQASLRLTAMRRPDLLAQARLVGCLSRADEAYLQQLEKSTD